MSVAPLVRLVPTGIANVASITAGLERAGADVAFARDATEIERASHIVVPGVGAFGAAMERLRATDMIEPLRARLLAGKPTLAICLGMQLLFEISEESPGVRGLGVVPGSVRRFTGDLIVPQMGWNEIAPDASCSFLRAGAVYFANSFRITGDDAPAGYGIARGEYGGAFVAGFERGAVLACQFHPELSGVYGLSLLRRWILAGMDEQEASC